MKNRFVKPLTVVLALALLLPVFALAGCADDKDKPHTLDSVELSIVGTWSSDDITRTFKSDGTYEMSNGNHGEFRHTGDGIETDGEARGHYEIINLLPGGKLILFDIYPDKLIVLWNDKGIEPTNSSNTYIRQ